MSDWQSELEVLLSRLAVSLDQPATVPPHGATGDARQAHLAFVTEDADELWDAGATSMDDPPSVDDEVAAVRGEIEATLQRVIELARNGCIDGVLRDDVIFILQALVRPHPPVINSGPHDIRARELHQEWHLGSAAAVLRFCRIVARLTDALSRDYQP